MYRVTINGEKMKTSITLSVNGKQHSLPSLPGETLADLLRHRLRLTGTKIACEESECGSCTVLVDGEPILSCMYPAERAHGKSVLTIEGVAGEFARQMERAPGSQGPGNVEAATPKLHPLQEAFIQHGAVQCGFCIPGQIMTSYALLQRNPNPSQEEIRVALKDTLCRCAGYQTIENAIQAAAASLQTGEPVVGPSIPDSINAHNIVGRTLVRPDAVEKVTGEAQYTDDLEFEGMLQARVRRAGVPHAFLKTLDVSKARALPGVVVVLTADDIPGERNHGLVIYDWPVMVGVGTCALRRRRPRHRRRGDGSHRRAGGGTH